MFEREELVFALVKAYTRIWVRARNRGWHLRGLEPLVRLLRNERWIDVNGKRLMFAPAIGTSYLQLLIGLFNEPETHGFIRAVLDGLRHCDHRAQFVDVGANIGEFLTDLGDHSSLESAIGFEPVPACAAVCQANMYANKLDRCKTIAKAIYSEVTEISFQINATNSTGSRIDESELSLRIQTSTIDREIPDYTGAAIMLIDVEGYEIEVLKGATSYLSRNCPLIIFEYNHLGRGRYALTHVQELLGSLYKIFRLRSDGRLDSVFEQTWNCVAVCQSSVFWPIAEGLLVT